MKNNILKLRKVNDELITTILFLEDIKRKFLIDNQSLFLKFLDIPFKNKEIVENQKLYREEQYLNDLKNLKDINLLLFLKKFKIPDYLFKDTKMHSIIEEQQRLKSLLLFANYGIIVNSFQRKLPKQLQTEEYFSDFLSAFFISILKYDHSKSGFTTFLTLRLSSKISQILRSNNLNNFVYVIYDFFTINKSSKNSDKFLSNFIKNGYFELIENQNENIELFNTKSFPAVLNFIIKNESIYKSSKLTLNISGLRQKILEKFKKENPEDYLSIRSDYSSENIIFRTILELIIQDNIGNYNNMKLSCTHEISLESSDFLHESEKSYSENEIFNEDIEKIFIFYMLKRILKDEELKQKKINELVTSEKVNLLKSLLMVYNKEQIKNYNNLYIIFKREIKVLNFVLEQTSLLNADKNDIKLVKAFLKTNDVKYYIGVQK